MGLSAVLGGLSLASGVISGMGQAAAEKHAAQQSEQAAQIGRIQADQIDASYRDQLNSTIANIRAIRASTGTGVDSPTERAIIAKNQQVSDTKRTAAVASRQLQADQDQADASFRRNAAGWAFAGGATQGAVKSLPYFFNSGA